MDDENFTPEPPNMAWLLTFADLVSLLITFFVLLYSMKVVDTQKWDELKGTFSGVFSIREPIYEVRPDKDTSIEKIDPIVGDNLEYIQSLLTHDFSVSEHLKDAKLSRDMKTDSLVISIANDSMFQADSDDLNEEGEAKVAELGDVLRHLDNRIEIAGHTGKHLVRTREFPSNWELSMMRAIHVAKLLEKEGIERDITTSGYGFSRFEDIDPFLPEDKREKLADRVEIILHTEKER